MAADRGADRGAAAATHATLSLLSDDEADHTKHVNLPPKCMAACCSKFSNLPCSPQTNTCIRSNRQNMWHQQHFSHHVFPAQHPHTPSQTPWQTRVHCTAVQANTRSTLWTCPGTESLEHFTNPQAETTAARLLIPVGVATQHTHFIRQLRCMAHGVRHTRTLSNCCMMLKPRLEHSR